MDKRILVADGHALLRLLDETVAAPRGAMWVNNPDAGRWELWVLPAKGIDPVEFDGMVTDALMDHPDHFIEIHRAVAPMIVWTITDDHLVVPVLNDLYRLEGLGEHFLGTRRLGRWVVEDAILLRWDTEQARTEAAFELSRDLAPRRRHLTPERTGRALIEGRGPIGDVGRRGL